jgi:hypothetical protein
LEVYLSDLKQKCSIQDRARERWKYLFVRAGTSTLWCYGLLLTIASAILTMVIIGWLLLSSPWTDPLTIGVGVFGAITTATISFIGVCNLREAKHISRHTIYVPPVREQLAALPAEEVLVRGSDQPRATSTELLRAITEISQTPSEELLRSGTHPARDG